MCMVIGNGVIANRFADYISQSRYLIFAGSVHDSTICDKDALLAEESAVKAALSKHSASVFVYFSTCSILDESVCETPYVKHKVRMEKTVEESASKYIIIRLPKIMGLNDSKTSLINYLCDAIYNNKPFDVWQNSYNNIIDIDDVHEILSEVLVTKPCINTIINIASPGQTPILGIVSDIEKFFNVTANYKTLSKGVKYDIDISAISSIISRLGIDFGELYIKQCLRKYYGHLLGRPGLLSVIVPTYNEEYGIEEFYRRTKNVLQTLSPRFEHEIIFVNDFSTDKTLDILLALSRADATVKLINFSRNFGNQIGITAGIDYSCGDIAVIIDDDLQDPPEVILNFIYKWSQGYKVVYGVRPRRQGVNPLFKVSAKLYYRLIGKLSETKIPNDTGDFRLVDRVVIDALKRLKEENRYYRGLVAWVGFSQIGVAYERDKRYAGQSTFSFSKYVNFALNGLTSFTEKPLFFSSIAGSIITFVSFILAIILVISKIANPAISIQGWTSLTVIILFFGGIQLLSIGVLGIYISKIYREVKGRPLYIVESTKNIEQFNNE